MVQHSTIIENSEYMKIRYLFLTLFLTICFSVTAQVDSFQQDIIDYLNINGTPQQYEGAYEEMFNLLKKQFASANVPEEFWVNLYQGKEKSVDEVIAFLTFAYRKHFTREEIAEMTKFYETEAAQKMVLQSGDLSSEENEKITAFFNSEIGKKIEEKRDALSEDIAEISGHWSRDLFSEKMSALVKAGYFTQH